MSLYQYISIIEERILIFKCNKLNWNFFSSPFVGRVGQKKPGDQKGGRKREWKKSVDEMKQNEKNTLYSHTKSKK